MTCPNGYIEVNGNCVYAFGNAAGVNPDGTPQPAQKRGGFWDWINQNLPDILIAAGSVWQSSQQQHPSPQPSANPQPPPEVRSKMPVWAWIALAAALIVILFLLLRPRASGRT